MNIFNNRELSIIIWAIAVLMYIVIFKRKTSIISSFIDVLKAFFHIKIITVVSAFLLYVIAIVLICQEFYLWDSSQWKNTILWVAFVGTPLLFKLEKIRAKPAILKDVIIDNIKVLGVFEFIFGLYSFPLAIELIAQPALFIIATISVIAGKNDEFHLIKKICDNILVIFGLSLSVFTIYKLATDFSSVENISTLYDFSTPLLLSILCTPIVLLVMIYSFYETIFIRLNLAIPNKKLNTLAKIYSILIFNINIKLLDRWSHHVSLDKINTHRQLIETIKHIFHVRHAEKNPAEVPPSEGWSPYKAKDFLIDSGITTGFYNKSFDCWHASSTLITYTDDIMPDNIAYYVEGTDTTAKELKIKINVNNNNRSDLAMEKLNYLANMLSIKSLNRPISSSIENAILNMKNNSELIGNKRISLEFNSWLNHPQNGFDIRFIIESI
ncbi:hypothetical protein [Tolumonas osonensis]|uniref:Uncharacterized protein n=1 Tax=Tolumonas osonensis TaxID=675874 RepID=A0A841GDF7_9GAMM|nr:hypothetical protein [Tolumonas osonensis]MBB6057164.1 hypothetical protein [Tolumonas osonensis]